MSPLGRLSIDHNLLAKDHSLSGLGRWLLAGLDLANAWDDEFASTLHFLGGDRCKAARLPCLWPCSNIIFCIAFDIVLSIVFYVIYPYYVHTPSDLACRNSIVFSIAFCIAFCIVFSVAFCVAFHIAFSVVLGFSWKCSCPKQRVMISIML